MLWTSAASCVRARSAAPPLTTRCHPCLANRLPLPPQMWPLPLLSCPVACRLPTALKRMAVPYRAADTPSERSEFAQPDVAIVLTLLSYANDGLLKEELKQAVEQLLGKGETAQRDHYGQWLAQGELKAWEKRLQKGGRCTKGDRACGKAGAAAARRQRGQQSGQGTSREG